MTVGVLVLAVVAASYFGLLGERLQILFIVIPGGIAAIEIFRVVFVEKSETPRHGLRIQIEGDKLRQLDGGRLVAEIDLLCPYEYKILDRYDVKNSIFRLYQGEKELTFYTSDPGGLETVRDVLQISWPPRDRHVGRSFPPAAA